MVDHPGEVAPDGPERLADPPPLLVLSHVRHVGADHSGVTKDLPEVGVMLVIPAPKDRDTLLVQLLCKLPLADASEALLDDLFTTWPRL